MRAACKATANAPKIARITFKRPPTDHTQAVLLGRFQEVLKKHDVSNQFSKTLDTFFRNSKVQTRGSLFGLENILHPRSRRDNDEQLYHAATDQVAGVVRELMLTSQVSEVDISKLLCHTTAFMCPTLDGAVIRSLGFASSKHSDMIAPSGCVGGALTMAKAADHAENQPSAALVACVTDNMSGSWLNLQHEIEAGFKIQNEEERRRVVTQTLLSASLFGDGAAAMLVLGSQHPRYHEFANGPTIVHTHKHMIDDTDKVLGLFHHEKHLQIELTKELPRLCAQHIPGVLQQLMEGYSRAHPDQRPVRLSDVKRFCVHPGGAKILELLQPALNITAHDMRHSYASLAANGNMGCVSVWDVVRRTMEEVEMERATMRAHRRAHTKPEYGIVVAIGPGIVIQSVLLRWN
jgi:alkylresorcinol/alkylpyrone synthase